MTVHQASDGASDRPSAPEAYQCKLTQSTGMATQMQLKVLTWPPGLLERKNKKKGFVFFGVIFYSNVDNRERARASY